MMYFALLGIAALVWRKRQGRLTRVEILTLAVAFVAVSLVWLQIVICDHKPFPERRYYSQALLLIFPWAVWGLRELCRIRRWPFARILGAAVVGIAIYDGVMLVKAGLPVGRRAAYSAACDWAAKEIAADWKGPARDAEIDFMLEQYVTPARPIVDGYTRRIAYLVGGRRLSNQRLDVEVADYWIGDMGRQTPPAEGYEKMGEFTHGKYSFGLYRRMPEVK